MREGNDENHRDVDIRIRVHSMLISLSLSLSLCMCMYLSLFSNSLHILDLQNEIRVIRTAFFFFSASARVYSPSQLHEYVSIPLVYFGNQHSSLHSISSPGTHTHSGDDEHAETTTPCSSSSSSALALSLSL